MKCLIQRVNRAEVKVDGESKATIGKGLLVYVGFSADDSEGNADYIIDRVSKIRIFEDECGRLNRSLEDISAEILIVPNFTLYADASTGRRPSFVNAMAYDKAVELFNYSICRYNKIAYANAQTGIFGADMQIESVADGPVNILIEYNGAK